MDTIEQRIQRLLDRLELKTLRPFEVEAIKDKIAFLRSLR